MNRKQPTANDVVFEGLHCRLTISRPATGVCVATFAGPDVGEFNDKPISPLTGYLVEWKRLRLFINEKKSPAPR